MDIVTRLAMAHPDIAFSVRADGRETLRTSGCGNYAETVAEALGANVARDLVPVRCENENILVHGFVSRPTLTRPTRAGQHFWVNRHPVQNRVLLHGFDSGYRAILPTDRHPYAVLFVEMAPGTVDVNVHPRKADVRFLREQAVHSAMYHAVRDGLLAADLRPELNPEPLLPAPGFGEEHPLLPLHHGPVTFLPPPSVQPSPPPPAYDPEDPFADPPPPIPQSGPAPAQQTNPGMRSTFRVLGQIQNTFLVVEGERGLMLVDQHVAHERVLYEELGRQMTSAEPERQHLLLPMAVKLDSSEMGAWVTHRAGLERAGFEIEEFGADSVLIRAVPALLASRFSERTFRDLVSELSECGSIGTNDDLREHILSAAACKSAVKAGDALEPEEMSGLMDALFRTTNPYLCPHGRPIMLHLTVDDLMKKFQRA